MTWFSSRSGVPKYNKMCVWKKFGDLLHPGVVIKVGSNSHGLAGTGPVDGPALVGRAGPAAVQSLVGHGQSLVAGQDGLGALLGLLRRNLEIERRLVMAHELHVAREHGELSDELEGGGGGEEHDRFGHGLELAGHDLDGRPLLHGIAEGDDLPAAAGLAPGGRDVLVGVGRGGLALHHDAAEGTPLAL